MKKKKTQIVINILTIINILAILIIVYIMIKENMYSRKFIYELAEKNINTSIYSMVKKIYYVKDDKTRIEKILQNENGRREEDLENGFIRLYYNNFIIYPENKTYSNFIGYKVEEDGSETKIDITTKEVVSWHILMNEFEGFKCINSSPDYKYLKKEEINNKKCIVVEFINSNEDTVKIWFDLETGLIAKEEYYIENVLDKEIVYETEVNNVINADLRVPNLEEYTFVEMKE